MEWSKHGRLPPDEESENACVRCRKRQRKRSVHQDYCFFFVFMLIRLTMGFTGVATSFSNRLKTYRIHDLCRITDTSSIHSKSKQLHFSHHVLFPLAVASTSSFPDASPSPREWKPLTEINYSQSKGNFSHDKKSKHNSYNKPRSGNKANKFQSNKSRIRELFRIAKEFERKGQWRKSASLLQDILKIDPTDAHSYLALARLEARRQRSSSVVDTASQIFSNGTQACPDSIHLWQAWAVYEESRGHTDTAKKLFEEALKLDPYNPYVCHAYGLMLKRSGASSYCPEARVLWERSLEKNSTAALVCSLGEMLIANKEFEQARELYVRHVALLHNEKEKTEVYLALAWLEERYFSDFDRAVDLLEMSLAFSPSSSVAQVALARLKGRIQQRLQSRGINRDTLDQEQHLDESRAAMAHSLARACMRIESESKEKQPVDGRVYNAWAHLEVKANHFSNARKILLRGLTHYPKDHSLLQAAGKVEERLGNYSGARDFYRASLLVQPSAPALVAYALLELRRPLENDELALDFEHIKQLFEEALMLDPRHGPAYNAYARCVFERHRDEQKAQEIYERGVRANCTDVASIYHGYAKLELSLGNVNRAREILLEGRNQVRQHSIGMDSPHRERALFLTHTLGMMELNRNRPSDALEVFLDGIDRYGNSSQLLLGAALCEVRLGKEYKARQFFERSLLSDEKHAHAWQAWGVMEMRAGNFHTAKTLFECGIKSAPNHGALWQAYGTMQSRLGNTENARALFEQGIRMSPKHVPSYQSWASMELREENVSVARALITKALTLDKRNGSGWIIAAEIEQLAGNSGLVNLILRRGIECSPNNPKLYCALGNALVQQGKIIEAREVMEKGIEVDPLHAPLYHALAELEARVGNIEGLSKLTKRAAKFFNPNTLEPAPASSEIWGSKIHAGRSRDIPKGVAALAQRIVEDDGFEHHTVYSDHDNLLDEIMISSGLLEDGLVGELLLVPDLETNSQKPDILNDL